MASFTLGKKTNEVGVVKIQTAAQQSVHLTGGIHTVKKSLFYSKEFFRIMLLVHTPAHQQVTQTVGRLSVLNL